MMRHSLAIFTVVVAASIVSCSRTPSYVIDPDDMAELLADIKIAGSVADMNHNEFSTDSAKIALRQAVFAKHGVTSEDFDTSLAWYGSNMDKYLEVYDNVIKILEKRDRELGSSIVQTAISISGDSVDVWPGSRYAIISRRMPSDMVTFDISSDENWEPGDVYTWRMKTVDDGFKSIKWNILATYSDSTCEWLNSSSSNTGWNEVVFAADSTKTLTNLRGSFELLTGAGYDDEVKTNADKEIWVDSISLVRKRTNPEFYNQRSRLRKYRVY